MADNSAIAPTDIAVVGIAVHFPGARDVEAFWDNLCGSVESVRSIAPDTLQAAGVSDSLLHHPDYVRAGVPLADLDRFDPGFFGMSPREASIMDPQQRHFLECAWEALEHAGYPPGSFPGAVGVYAGSGPNSYLIYNLLSDPELVERDGIFLLRHTGNDKDVLATRVSYQMNLRGPSINVQTACSTSLVAVHMACQSLLNQECDLALAGAVSIEIPHAVGYLYRESEILARDGHCRAFDAASSGTVFGSGAGVVVLRRLSDAVVAGDTIHAVIKGTAVNNDGSRKVGYLAPSVEGQIDVISEALAVSGVEPGTIDYIEAHGTGTAVGDPIEVAALTRVFAPRERPLHLGSVKTNIGHLDTAAGMAGLVKTILAIKHGRIPPTLHFRTPNPLIDFDRAQIRVVDRLSPWNPAGTSRRAGVTSLGIGGTNVHVVLEQPPESVASPAGRPWRLLTLAARSSGTLDAATTNLAQHLERHPEQSLDDVAYTLHVGRTAFPHRRAVVCRDHGEGMQSLATLDAVRVNTGDGSVPERAVAFLFSGQGSQYVAMARQLYESEPVFRRWVDECATLAMPHLGLDVRELIFPPDADASGAADRIRQTWNTQPILFIVEYALAQLWMAWGIKPSKLIGHSIGEYTAACVAGVFELADAIAIVCARGLLMREIPGGSMLAVALPESEIEPYLVNGISLAAVNAPDQCVLAGTDEAIAALERRLAPTGTPTNRLRTSHAFHSSMMDPVLDRFVEVVHRVPRRPPSIPLLSNVTGTWLGDDEATDPHYWAKHLRGTVRFGAGLAALLSEPDLVLLEVGPGETLAAIARQHPARNSRQKVMASLPRAADAGQDAMVALATLGKLWVAGVPVNWNAFHAGEGRRRVPLPTYPFDRRRCWLGPSNASTLVAGVGSAFDDWFYRPNWVRSTTTVTSARERGSWVILADGAGLGAAIAESLRARGETAVLVRPGSRYREVTPTMIEVDAAAEDDYVAMLSRVAERGPVAHVVHLWSLDHDRTPEERSFHSMLHVLRALARQPGERTIEVAAVSSGSVSVNGERVVDPYGALLAGPVRVAAEELPQLRCRQIDLGQSLLAQPAAATLLLRELEAEATEALVAYRGDVRWREDIVRVRPSPGDSRLRDRGVYLVTGGLGGLGLSMAEWLARTVHARLVLVSRNAESRAEAERERLAEIERSGGEVLVCSADVADARAMREALECAHERFGVVHGVIHAAGVLDDGVIELKRRERAERVLSPKVRGTVVLGELLAQTPLDFFLLCSSVSALQPPAGQVDYSAANAFLNAYAASRPPEQNVIAVGWGPWAEVGMAARTAPTEKEPMRHAILDRVVVDAGSRLVLSGALSLARHWIVGEHRFRGGDALFPGTGYLDVAVTAAWRTFGRTAVELRDVVFLAPLRVSPEGEHPFRVEVRRVRGSSDFSVTDRSGLLASGNCVPVHNGSRRLERESIRRRCTISSLTRPTNVRQSRHFDFGKRWASVQHIAFGTRECLASLELAPEYRQEVADYALHPALLDMATGVAMFLVPGYDGPGDLMLPVSYKRLTVHGPLPARVDSHARLRAGAASDLVSFDITIADEDGNVIIEAEEFTVKRLAGVGALPNAAAQTERSTAVPAVAEARIGTSEGLQALQRLLAAHTPTIVYVTPTELRPTTLPSATRISGAASPETSTTGSTVDDVLGQIWQRLLGLDHVDGTTDFFESGGHSLIAVRLFAEIRKRFGVDLALSTLFESRTLSSLAATIAAAQRPDEDVDEPAAAPPAPGGTATAERPRNVIAIRKGGGKPPLFLVHNVGGRVLIYEDLARFLPPDQPVYGIEARGFHGFPQEHSIREMATLYIQQMRALQPGGPYFVAGHSFGGLVAFEIGRRLHEQGADLGLVGIFDTLLRENQVASGPMDVPAGAMNGNAATPRRRMHEFLTNPGRIDWLRTAVSARTRKATQWSYRTAHRLAQSAGGNVPAWMRSVEQACWVATYDYVIAPSETPVVLYRCQDRSRWDHPDYLMGWGRVTGHIEVCEVPGDHLSMVRAPAVRAVSEHIAQRIEQRRTAAFAEGIVDAPPPEPSLAGHE